MSIELENINNSSEKGGDTPASSFPTIVTDSGSSLPSASGYQEGDTFLNTTDKKIYKAEVNGYVANTNTTLTVDVDYTTGIASGFANSLECIRSGLTNQWYGTSKVKHSVKFKISSVQASPVIAFSAGGGGSYTYAMFYVSNEGKIFHKKYLNSYGSVIVQFDNQILDTVVITDKIYILNITKEGTSCIAQLTDENGTILEEKNFITENLSSGTNSVFYGTGRIGSSNVYSSNLSVYLGQSAGELVISNTSTLLWDNGTDIADKTEIADKTNGALYLYENSELVKIPQNKIFTNVSASSWASDSTYADYGYKCELSCSGVTANMFAQVVFAPAQADSGNYATVCLTGNGTVTIYSKVNDTISIPSIVVMGV